MKVKLKSVKEVLDMEQSKGNNYPTREEMLCYIPERFLGKTIEAEYQDLKYAERPPHDILFSNAKQLQNLLEHLDINNVIIVPEVEGEIEYSIVESE